MTVPLGILIVLLLAANLLAFAAIGLDKRKAVNGSRNRTRESLLLLLGLPLAAPGMLLGIRTFRHKTRKLSFQMQAVLVVFANLLIAAAFGWLAMKGQIQVALALY